MVTSMEAGVWRDGLMTAVPRIWNIAFFYCRLEDMPIQALVM